MAEASLTYNLERLEEAASIFLARLGSKKWEEICQEKDFLDQKTLVDQLSVHHRNVHLTRACQLLWPALVVHCVA